MTWLLWLGLVLCLLAIAAVGVCVYGSKRWADTTRTLTRRLESTRLDAKDRSPTPGCSITTSSISSEQRL